MVFKIFNSVFANQLLAISAIFLYTDCNVNQKQKFNDKNVKVAINLNASQILPFLQHWNLILGDVPM